MDASLIVVMAAAWTVAMIVAWALERTGVVDAAECQCDACRYARKRGGRAWD